MLLWELGFLHRNSKLWVYENLDCSNLSQRFNKRLEFQIDPRILSRCFYGNFSFWIETWIFGFCEVLDLLEIIPTI